MVGKPKAADPGDERDHYGQFMVYYRCCDVIESTIIFFIDRTPVIRKIIALSFWAVLDVRVLADLILHRESGPSFRKD
jgi:hypothetical protein